MVAPTSLFILRLYDIKYTAEISISNISNIHYFIAFLIQQGSAIDQTFFGDQCLFNSSSKFRSQPTCRLA